MGLTHVFLLAVLGVAGAAPTTTVLIMRHCIRSTKDYGIEGTPHYHDYNDYSAKAWPEWNVEGERCLERGTKLIERQGAWASKHLVLPEPIKAVVDDSHRDETTGNAFFSGLGVDINDQSWKVDHHPFHHATYSHSCPKPSHAEDADVMRKSYAARPMPQPEFSKLMAKVYAAMGEGAAGNWTAVDCHVSHHGHLKGNCQAAAEFVERMLMEWGGGYQVAWGNFNPDELQQLLVLHTWFRQVVHSKARASVHRASIARDLLAVLDAAEGGTTIFVGHDTQQNGLNAILDLGWDASPLPVNATVPGSFLRFDLTEDTVSATYHFIANFSREDGEMTNALASFGQAWGNSVPLSELRNRVESNSNVACANPWDGFAIAPTQAPTSMPTLPPAGTPTFAPTPAPTQSPTSASGKSTELIVIIFMLVASICVLFAGLAACMNCCRA